MDGSATAQQSTPEVEQLVDALIDGKLAWYLLDTDTANELIKEIAEETRLPRAAVRIAFKLLAPLLIKKGRDAGGWFGHKLIGRSTGLLVKLPGYELVAGKLLSLHAKLDADVTRRRQLDAILAGERPASDLEHAEGLSKDLRLGLRELAELEEMRAYIGDQFDRLFDFQSAAAVNPEASGAHRDQPPEIRGQASAVFRAPSGNGAAVRLPGHPGRVFLVARDWQGWTGQEPARGRVLPPRWDSLAGGDSCRKRLPSVAGIPGSPKPRH